MKDRRDEQSGPSGEPAGSRQDSRRLRDVENVVNRSPVMLFLWRSEPGAWPVEYVSENVESILGYTAREFMSGQVSWPGITHPDDRTRLEAEVADCLNNRTWEWSRQYRIVCKSGETRWMQDWNRALLDDGGSVTHVQASVIDITTRRQAEQALRRSEQLLRHVIDNTRDVIFRIDVKGNYIFANAAAEQMTGYPLERILRMNMVELVAPEHHALVRERLRQRIDGQVLESPFEFQILHRDGHRIWAELTTTGVLDNEGRLMAVQGVARDVTVRKETDEALHRESHERFRSLFLDAGVGAVVMSIEGRFVQVNPAFCFFLGLTEAELIGKNVLDVTHPDDCGATSERLARASGSESSVGRAEKRFLHKSGRVLWGEVSLAVVRDSSGEPVFAIGQVVDITARKQAEDDLRNRELLLDLAVKGTNGGIWSLAFDPNAPGVVPDAIYLCPVLKAMIGFGPDEFPGSVAAWQSRIVPTDRAALQKRAGDHLAGIADLHEAEYQIRHKDGSLRWLHSRGKIQRDERGMPIRWTGIGWDVTERRQAEEALRRANDELEKKVEERTAQLRALAGKLTHAEHEERRRLVNVLHDELQQLLVGAQFKASRLAWSGSTADRQRMVEDLNEVLVKAIATSRSLSVSLRPPVLYAEGLGAAVLWLAKQLRADFELDVRVDGEDVVGPASEEQRDYLFQAVRELLFNVVKHAGVKDAQVRLAQTRSDGVQIVVKDLGKGFDVERIDVNDLGLFGIRERATLLGGDMQVVSAPGKGTTVTLTLPGA